MNWLEISKEIGVLGIISGAIVWLSKQLSQFFIEKKFKAYELELKYKSDNYTHQLDKSLENHRTELNIIFSKASKLHEKRFEIIAELYKKLVLMNNEMRLLTELWKLGTTDEIENDKDERLRIEKAGKSYNSFQIYYTENKIFFTVKICQLIDEIQSKYFDSYWDYTTKERFGITNFDFNYENAKKASVNVNNQIPPILFHLEEEFRQLIGVEDKN